MKYECILKIKNHSYDTPINKYKCINPTLELCDSTIKRYEEIGSKFYWHVCLINELYDDLSFHQVII